MTHETTPAKGRKTVVLYVTLPPAARQRQVDFAARIDRPFNWVVRDALAVYLDAAEKDPAAAAALRGAD